MKNLYNFLQELPGVTHGYTEFGNDFEEVFYLPSRGYPLNYFSDYDDYRFEVTSGFFGPLSYRWHGIEPEDIPREILKYESVYGNGTSEPREEKEEVWHWLLIMFMEHRS